MSYGRVEREISWVGEERIGEKRGGDSNAEIKLIPATTNGTPALEKQPDLTAEQEQLLVEQTRMALAGRIQENDYIVMRKEGIVLETPRGAEANSKYKDLLSSGAGAFLLAPGETFVLDNEGKLRLIEEINAIHRRTIEKIDATLGLVCD